MANAVIYLDESGDLGWRFDRPYRHGGSSRHLTLAAVVCADGSQKFAKRFVRDTKQAHQVDRTDELKWSGLGRQDRTNLARRCALLTQRRTAIGYHAITVQKQNVASHIRHDENKLYNYMVKLLLLEEMAKYDRVTFLPDERTIKVQSGNSLHDYLQTELWFEKHVQTQISTQHSDSSSLHCLQLADWVAGMVQSAYEDTQHGPIRVLGNYLSAKRLFFR